MRKQGVFRSHGQGDLKSYPPIKDASESEGLLLRTLLRQLAYIRTALGSLEVESSITNLEERGDLPSVTQWSGLESSPLVPSPVFFLPHKHPPHGLQTKACIMNTPKMLKTLRNC